MKKNHLNYYYEELIYLFEGVPFREDKGLFTMFSTLPEVLLKLLKLLKLEEFLILFVNLAIFILLKFVLVWDYGIFL